MYNIYIILHSSKIFLAHDSTRFNNLIMNKILKYKGTKILGKTNDIRKCSKSNWYCTQKSVSKMNLLKKLKYV